MEGVMDLRRVEVAVQAAGVAVGVARGQVGKEGVLEGTLEAEGVEIPGTDLASCFRRFQQEPKAPCFLAASRAFRRRETCRGTCR